MFVKNIIPHLKNYEILQQVLHKIKHLLNHSYVVEKLTLDEYIREFFNFESLKTCNKAIYVNYNGYKQKITKVGYDYNKIYNYNYEESIFK